MPSRETCRNWIEDGDYGGHHCKESADCIVWGKLNKPEHLGPRCYACAEEQLGRRNVHDPSFAIYHFPKLDAEHAPKEPA